MNKRNQLGWLALAALLVLGENAVFFSSQPERTLGVGRKALEDESYEADDGFERDESLEAVSAQVVDRWLATLATRSRNPFLTLAEAGGDSGVIADAMPRLVGTLTSESRRVAWLGANARAEGEWIGEHEVRRIEGDRVLLVRGVEELELWLGPPAGDSLADQMEDGEEEEHDANE